MSKFNGHNAEYWYEQFADWQRHGVKITEDCETCDSVDGNGIHYVEDTGPDGGYICPDCGGKGWQLRDGVKQLTPGKSYWISFPAEWLDR